MKHGIVGIFGACALFVTTVFFGSSIYAHEHEKEAGWPISTADKRTIYVAHWTHTPENCPGRSSNGAAMLTKFWEGRKKAEEKGVKILGAYVTVTEHDYYFIVEASDYSAVVEFFLPIIPTQTGKFVPVLTMDEWLRIIPK